MQGLMMDYQLTLDRILEHANRMFPHKQVRTKQPNGTFHSYTYADLYRRVKRLANVLEGLGVEPGDCVGTFAWNNYQHLELYYAIPGAGAICHTLNIRLAAEQLAYIINHADDKVIFVDGTLLPLFETLAGQIDGVKHIVLINAAPGTTTSFPNVHNYEELMAAADEAYTWRCTDEQMAMGLCYTSGTTGDPKGALYSHRSMYLHAIGVCMATSLGITENDVVLPVVPQFHVMAWGLPYACVYVGAEMIMPGPHLQAAPLAEMIDEYRVTVAAGVPTIWMGLYQELKQNPRDVSCIRALVVGGSAMPRSLTERYETELGVNVVHAWGMTEMSPLGTICNLQRQHVELPQHERLDLKAKQGYIVPGVEMRIVNDEGDELPWDGTTMGEVQVRGPWIIRGYFKRTPTPENFTADGWFRTGDVATISSDGYMAITDRTKDLIKSGGEWISSVALENMLMAHPTVAEAAVIAIPDAKWSERPLAVVVRAPDCDAVDTQVLLDYLIPQVARFWLPDRIVEVEAVPKTSVGKFDKKVIRQQYAAGELA